jgi:cell division protein FtsI (penicillin-binding protein 3)
VMNRVGVKYNENIGIADEWINTRGKSSLINVSAKKIDKKTMPLLKGMNIKDAVYLCEEIGLKVNINGKGKVNNQSIAEGSRIIFGQTINIGLN